MFQVKMLASVHYMAHLLVHSKNFSNSPMAHLLLLSPVTADCRNILKKLKSMLIIYVSFHSPYEDTRKLEHASIDSTIFFH